MARNTKVYGRAMRIKICGLSTPETVQAAAESGASHVGFVHFEPSPRHLSLKRASELRKSVPASVKLVLLLVDMDIDAALFAIDMVGPDVVQAHGSETPEWLDRVRDRSGVEVWKAIPVRSEGALVASDIYSDAADLLLFDAPAPAESALPGGNGEGFDWSLLKGHKHALPWGLAGGLTPANVAEAIRVTGAGLVDASSGLETTRGVKDVDKIAAFCKAAREV